MENSQFRGRKISQDIMQSKRDIDSARHILKVILPISPDKRAMLKALEKTYNGAIKLIGFILKMEHLNKSIRMCKNGKENEEMFFTKCSKKYLTEEEEKLLKKLLFFGRKHKESGFEFFYRDKVVIMNDSLDTYEVNEKMLLSYIEILDKILIRKMMSLNN